MTRTLLVLNDIVLLLCVSMYVGTGWSTLLFSVPIAPLLTVENYALHFVPQVRAATKVFTALTGVIVVTGIVMFVSELDSWLVWVPVVVVAAAITSAVLTVRVIMPINRRMRAGIRDQGELQEALRRWVFLTRVRVVLWTLEWGTMAVFFGVRAR